MFGRDLFDKYIEDGGSQLDFFTKVLMDVYKVSGFYGSTSGNDRGEAGEGGGNASRIESISEYIEELYLKFLDMGYTPSSFWDSSLLEIYDLMDSYNRRKKNEMKELEEKLKAEISLNSVLARQIGEYVASLFNKEVQLTPLNNFFPSLFEEDEEEVNKDMAYIRLGWRSLHLDITGD